MEKYLSKNYFSGSILERANYSKLEKRSFIMYEGSLIELDLNNRKEKTIWQRLKRIMQK